MNERQKINLVERIFNAVELCGIMLVLMMALLFQIVFNELPCPLCLLQRIGFFGIAFGLMLNLRFGLRPSHYAIVILSALYTSLVALRQVALHVIPGTGSYGDPVFGLHFYTWSFIFAIIVIGATTLMMSIDRQYQTNYRHNPMWVMHIFFACLTGLVILNIVSTFMECGLKACPDNPTHYAMQGLFDDITI